MISFELIKKLGLKPTDKTFGVSAEQNVIIYLFEGDVYCAAMDAGGNPNEQKILFFTEEKHISFTNEFLRDCFLFDLRTILGISS